jgi:hypothetical protein
MRTPILMLAGLLAVTVPLQPAHAATCGANDQSGCMDVVNGVVDDVDHVLDNLCYDGPDTCDDYANDRVEAVLNAIDNLCGGSTSTCDDEVVDRLQPVLDIIDNLCDGYALTPCLYRFACGGPSVTYCEDEVNGLVQPTVDRVEDACGGSTATCDDTVLDAAEGVADNVVGFVDADGDKVPDALEGEICGRAALRDAVNGNAPYLGACVTAADYSPPSSGTYTGLVLAIADAVVGIVNGEVAYATEKAGEAVGTVTDTAAWAVGYAQDAVGDDDHDGVPDDREAFVCSLENQNDPADGTCDEWGYNPPVGL